MAERVAITESLLDTLADAISTKSGEDTPMTLAEMTDAVNGISAPTGTININSNGTHNVLAYATAEVNVPSGAATLQSKSKSYTPTESAQTETVSADVGYDGLSSVDVSIGAISSSYVGSGIDRRDSTDLSTRDDTVEAPAGYYASSASMSVASGTEGTPIATKGAVADNKVTITTSVTNTAGYIAGGTHSGASVNVSASELVSGTYNVTSSGNKDVTNYATASVPSGSATAAASISATGATASHSGTTLTLSKTVSNTPQVSAGYVSSGTAGNSSVSLSATDANFVAGNIKDGVSIFGLTGSYTGGGSSNWTLLGTKDCGTVSTSSTTAATINKDFTVSGVGDYDLLVVETSVNTKTNGRHAATARLIWLTASSAIGTKNGTAIATATWNVKLSSNGTATSRSNTTARGVYPYSCTLSTSGGVTSAAIVMYACYNSTQTGTINGAYTARVYGCKLYDLIGG